MLALGQAVDEIGKLYHSEGLLTRDYFLMDKIDKLRTINNLRSVNDSLKESIKEQVTNIQAYEQSSKAAEQAATQ